MRILTFHYSSLQIDRHLAVWGILLTYALFLSACAKEEPPKEEVLRPVRYEVIGSSDNMSSRTFSGVAKASNRTELSFRAGGIITSINVSKGQRVRKGALIATLDNIEATLDYEKAVAQVNSAESAMNTARNELDRVKALYERRTVSLSEYEQAKDGYQNALAQYESATRNKGIQETKIGYGFIYAPRDGIIADTDGKVNERVNAGDVFAILISGEEMEIEVGIAESFINNVEEGMSVDVSFPSLSAVPYKGTVSEISPEISTGASTFPVVIDLDKAGKEIRPGMAASVKFNFKSGNTADDALVVPMKAVGEDGTGKFVFVVEPENESVAVVKKQYVELGALDADQLVIKSGLKSGQLVATAGLQTLLDGQKVRFESQNQ